MKFLKERFWDRSDLMFGIELRLILIFVDVEVTFNARWEIYVFLRTYSNPSGHMTKGKNRYQVQKPVLKDQSEEILQQAGSFLSRNCRNGENIWIN